MRMGEEGIGFERYFCCKWHHFAFLNIRQKASILLVVQTMGLFESLPREPTDYEKSHTLEMRKAESQKVFTKNPHSIPIIVQPVRNMAS